MILFVSSIILFITLFIMLGLETGQTDDEIKWKLHPRLLLSLLAFVFTIISCLKIVPAGHTGVVTVFCSVVDQTYDSGIYLTSPWKRIITMDNRIQKVSTDMSGTTSDMQDVNISFTLNYQIDKQNASQIYKTIGTKYEATVITAQIANTVNDVLAKYTANELVSNRSEASIAIEKELTNNLAKYHITVVDTAIENLAFSDELVR